MPGRLRELWSGPLRSVADFYIPFRIFDVEINNAGKKDRRIFGLDAVEVGYSVFEPYRRRGYATEVVRALIDWASSEHDIQRFIASISPGNEPSLALVNRLGFKHIGQHWDEEDGEELEFELRLSASASDGA
jgi:RimJ/RimL family protein N-acetyltransferase